MQNLQGGLLAGFLHPNRLEPPLQGGVLFDEPAVLLRGGGTDELNAAPGQGGFDDVGCVNGPLGAAGADDGVQLIQEEDDVPRPGDLAQNVFHALLKFPPVLGSGDDGGQVQGQQPLLAEGVGDLPQRHFLGQTLGHGGFAHPGLPQEDGVVFPPADEDLDDPANLLLPAGDGVIAAAAGGLDHVPGVLVQQPGGGGGGGRRVVRLSPGAGIVGPAPAQGEGGLPVELVGVEAGLNQQLDPASGPLPEQAQQQMAAAHLVVAQALGLGHGSLHNAFQAGG